MRGVRLHQLLRRRKLRRPKAPALCMHDVTSPRVDPKLDGLRIGQLSDIHIRTGIKPKVLHAAVEMLNDLRPDLVVLTGDYVCLSPKPLPQLTAALQKLSVPAYAILGNHDHWSNARKVRQSLLRAGVDVLTNEHRVIRVRDGLLHLVGIDDSVTGHDDPESAFRGIPDGATQVVLSHDPKSADTLHRYRPALILSGHTHGGQVFIRRVTPFVSKRVGIKYLSGFFEINGALLYVTRGLGASVPLRFRSPLEVALLTLRSAFAARA